MVTEAVRLDLPQILTPLPGPRARAVIERDQTVLSPSYTRGYPLVASRGEGAIVEDVDGNRFLDFNAGIAVVATGHCHPQVVEAIQRQARAADPHVGHRFLLREHGGAGREAGGARAGRCAAARLFRQFRHGGDRGRHEAGALSHRAREVHRVPRSFPRPHAGRAVAHREQGRAAPRIRPAGAGRVPRRSIRIPTAVPPA